MKLLPTTVTIRESSFINALFFLSRHCDVTQVLSTPLNKKIKQVTNIKAVDSQTSEF